MSKSNTTINLLPEFDPDGNKIQTPATAIIRDIIIGIQTDRCTGELCPRIRLLIDLPDTSKVAILGGTTLKNLIAVYGDKLANWIGQKVSVCFHPGDYRRGGIRILPVIQ